MESFTDTREEEIDQVTEIAKAHMLSCAQNYKTAVEALGINGNFSSFALLSEALRFSNAQLDYIFRTIEARSNKEAALAAVRRFGEMNEYSAKAVGLKVYFKVGVLDNDPS